jgi:hypothetical protein
MFPHIGFNTRDHSERKSGKPIFKKRFCFIHIVKAINKFRHPSVFIEIGSRALHIYQNTQIFFPLVGLGFEVRASHLQSKHSTA